MKELVVYINALSKGRPGEHVMFYSRRADGPFYRWIYDERLGSGGSRAYTSHTGRVGRCVL